MSFRLFERFFESLLYVIVGFTVNSNTFKIVEYIFVFYAQFIVVHRIYGMNSWILIIDSESLILAQSERWRRG